MEQESRVDKIGPVRLSIIKCFACPGFLYVFEGPRFPKIFPREYMDGSCGKSCECDPALPLAELRRLQVAAGLPARLIVLEP